MACSLRAALQAPRAAASYLGLFDQLMELREQLCDAGVSRHQSHGADQGLARGGQKGTPLVAAAC